MESDSVENSTTRLSTMGPQAPPDISASRRSLATSAVTKGVPTAIVYCEGNFGQIDGKTANGLVRHSQAYRILSVIDSELAGRDSGQVLDNLSNGIPFLEDLEAVVTHEASIPDTLIYGVAPSTGKMSATDREVVLDAIALGMNIVSGLHEYLGDPMVQLVMQADGVSEAHLRHLYSGSRAAQTDMDDADAEIENATAQGSSQDTSDIHDAENEGMPCRPRTSSVSV